MGGGEYSVYLLCHLDPKPLIFLVSTYYPCTRQESPRVPLLISLAKHSFSCRLCNATRPSSLSASVSWAHSLVHHLVHLRTNIVAMRVLSLQGGLQERQLLFPSYILSCKKIPLFTEWKMLPSCRYDFGKAVGGE